MDNPKVTEKARLTTLKDKQLIACGKPTPETKDWMKKVAEAKKKKVEKVSKAQEKAKRKGQAMDIKELVINNSQRVIRAFKDILWDPPTRLEAFNNVFLDFHKFEAFNNAIPDLLGPNSSISTPKSLPGNNRRLNNSQKKKSLNKHWLSAWKIKFQHPNKQGLQYLHQL